MSTEGLPPRESGSFQPEPPRRRYPRIVIPTLLIVFGFLLLANNLGWVSWGFWESLGYLWPLILVLMGIELILTGHGAWGAIAATLAVLLVVGTIAAAAFLAPWSGSDRVWASWWTGSAPFGEVVVPSGRIVTEEVDLRDFTGVDVSGPFQINLKPGDSYRVAISINDNLRDKLDVSRQGQTLRIGLKNLSVTTGATFQADVTMPALRSLRMSGATKGVIQGFKSSDEFDLELSGASSLQGDVQAARMQIECSGASYANLRGAAGDIDIEASGASRLDMKDFSVGTANVAMSGACGAELTVIARLDAYLSGASRLSYYGDPTLGRTEISGGSDLRHQ